MPPVNVNKDKLGRRMGMKTSQVDKDQSCCTRFTRIMISHVGLFLIVAIYAGVGAYVFIDLENPQEVLNNKFKKKVSLDIRDSKNYIVSDMWLQNTQNHTASKFKALAMNNLKQFHDFVVSGVQNNNYDGFMDTEVFDWTYTNSLLFTFTTIAAIGYGHISPKTFYGQIFCIFYGLIGVPLLLVFLANIGDPLARIFRYTYSRGCCLVCRMTRKKNEAKKGMPSRSVFKEEVGTEKYMPTDEVQVPITVTVCLLSVYLTIGGILFKVIEGWQFYEAAYFSFITLSTIGFGDFVPGKSFNMATGSALMAALQMMATIGFSLFGMALLSMCINLIQEQIVNKFRWMAKELGMNNKEEKLDFKNKYRVVNADGTATVTPNVDDNDFLKNKEEKPVVKFMKRNTCDDDFDSL